MSEMVSCGTLHFAVNTCNKPRLYNHSKSSSQRTLIHYHFNIKAYLDNLPGTELNCFLNLPRGVHERMKIIKRYNWTVFSILIGKNIASSIAF